MFFLFTILSYMIYVQLQISCILPLIFLPSVCNPVNKQPIPRHHVMSLIVHQSPSCYIIFDFSHLFHGLVLVTFDNHGMQRNYKTNNLRLIIVRTIRYWSAKITNLTLIGCDGMGVSHKIIG